MTRRVIGAAIAIWLLLSVSLWAGGWDPDVLVLGGILVAGGVMVFVAVDLAIRVRPAVWPNQPDPADFPVEDHERLKVLLGDLYGSERTDTLRIREVLLRTMDQRLLVNHGVERSAQPQAAGELLTPRLLRLVDGPSRDLASVRVLRSILTDLEEL